VSSVGNSSPCFWHDIRSIRIIGTSLLIAATYNNKRRIQISRSDRSIFLPLNRTKDETIAGEDLTLLYQRTSFQFCCARSRLCQGGHIGRSQRNGRPLRVSGDCGASAELSNAGVQVIFYSSGAVGMGKRLLGTNQNVSLKDIQVSSEGRGGGSSSNMSRGR
jgi:hypothetical protein